MKKSALEFSFPFERLHPVAAQESWRKEVSRPVYHMHKWWANRLGSVFRTILLAAKLSEDADVWAEFYRKQDSSNRVVLDPFMGSGTTIGEALKLGYKAVGCDINPVAYFQARKALEGASEADLRAGFDRLERRVAHKIREYYRSTCEGVKAEILYTFWVNVLDCPDCCEPTRLFGRWIFSSNAYPRRKPESKALCPSCGDVLDVLYTDKSTECPGCKHTFDPRQGPARGQFFNCEGCDARHRIVDVVRAGDQPPRQEMYALMLLLPDGKKVYKRVDQEDRELYERASRELREVGLPIPEVEIPPGFNTNQARGYNYRYWHQMFNDRQLRTLGILLQGIQEEEDQNIRELLLLLFSGVLEFNNIFCSFKGEGTGAVRHVFSHHILKPERTPLEAHPWGTPKSSGSFSTLFERRLLRAKRYCLDPFELRVDTRGGKATSEKVHGINHELTPRLASEFSEILSGRADALLLTGDSSSLPIPADSVDLVVTDPPYFDNVHYSELADFFFVWLKHGLGTKGAFSAETSRSVREVQATEASDFARLLGDVFQEAARVLKSAGLMAFTFHHSRSEAWLAVAEALATAGFEVVAAHPVKEGMSVAVPKQQAKEPISLDLVVVCRHEPKTSKRRKSISIDAHVKKAASYVERFVAQGISLSRGDVRVILMGSFLQLAVPSEDRRDEIMNDLVDRIEDLYSLQGGLRAEGDT